MDQNEGKSSRKKEKKPGKYGGKQTTEANTEKERRKNEAGELWENAKAKNYGKFRRK